MIAPFGRTLVFAALPVVTMIAGAVLATVWVPGRRMRSLIQHFAAGVVFSVVAVELLPDFLHERPLWVVGVGFGAGVALMLLIRRVSGSAADEVAHEAHGSVVPDGAATPTARAADRVSGGAGRDEPGGVGLLVPVAVDALLDGVLIGVGFVAGAKEGVLLALALALEMFTLGLALTTTLRSAGSPPLRSALLTASVAALILVGALGGAPVLRGASPHVLAGVFAFASAALLYLVTEELLVRAHAAAETTIAATMFFVGFLAFLLLGMAI